MTGAGRRTHGDPRSLDCTAHLTVESRLTASLYRRITWDVVDAPAARWCRSGRVAQSGGLSRWLNHQRKLELRTVWALTGLTTMIPYPRHVAALGSKCWGRFTSQN